MFFGLLQLWLYEWKHNKPTPLHWFFIIWNSSSKRQTIRAFIVQTSKMFLCAQRRFLALPLQFLMPSIHHSEINGKCITNRWNRLVCIYTSIYKAQQQNGNTNNSISKIHRATERERETTAQWRCALCVKCFRACIYGCHIQLNDSLCIFYL